MNIKHKITAIAITAIALIAGGVFFAAPVHAEDTLTTAEVEVLCTYVWDYPTIEPTTENDIAFYTLLFEIAGLCDMVFKLPLPYAHTVGWYIDNSNDNLKDRGDRILPQRGANHTQISYKSQPIHTTPKQQIQNDTPDAIFSDEYPYWFANEITSSVLTHRDVSILETVFYETGDIRYDTHETSIVFYLDSNKNFIGSSVEATSGDCRDATTICAVSTDWENVADKAWKLGAANIIFVHNHPNLPNRKTSFQCLPSAGDFTGTKERQRYFAENDITVYDEIVVARDCLYSLSAHRKQPAEFKTVEWVWRSLGYTDSEVARTTGWLIGYCWVYDEGYNWHGGRIGYGVYSDTKTNNNTIIDGGDNEYAAPNGTRCDWIEYIYERMG